MDFNFFLLLPIVFDTVEDEMKDLYACVWLSSFHRCTAHAQLAARLPLLHHSPLQCSQHHFLYLCCSSLSVQSVLAEDSLS